MVLACIASAFTDEISTESSNTTSDQTERVNNKDKSIRIGVSPLPEPQETQLIGSDQHKLLIVLIYVF